MGADLVLVHNEDLFAVADTIAKTLSTTLVFCAHGDLVTEHESNPPSHSLTSRVATSEVDIIAFSEAHAVHMERLFCRAVRPVRLPLSLLLEEGRGTRRQEKSPGLIAMAGRAVHAKGWDDAVRILQRVCPPYVARLHIGHGSDEIKTSVDRALASSSAQVCGWASRRELKEVLRSAAVTIVPSRFEPFGLIAAESMAMGSCVVGSAVGGLCELLDDGAGALIQATSGQRLIDLFVEQIERLMEDSDLRSQMQEAGRNKLLSFSPDRTMAAIRELASNPNVL
jgi:glycosyltransferase involved in cell wall biosynthesis